MNIPCALNFRVESGVVIGKSHVVDCGYPEDSCQQEFKS